ncbi:hypothetical protein SEEV1955_16722 [Salmonella enterica subsp. enterica serovar Virchow str. ATCC 51955]|nr:hypothetical protein SEEV1955_16722 [Salmonella enterica subsp. enterica serovar Virchow str. ATCC 51955]
MHWRALAVHRGKCAFTFDDKTQRRLVMAMTRRDFAGQDQL